MKVGQLTQQKVNSSDLFRILPSNRGTSPMDHISLLGPHERGPEILTDGLYGNLPVELFKTVESFYAFDSRNVCFLKIDEVMFDTLVLLRTKVITLQDLIACLERHPVDQIEAAYEEILRCQNEGLFTPYNFRRIPLHDNAEYDAVLSEAMGGFTVFVTTKCNLGCSYCIYGGQYEQHEKLSETGMTWETMHNAMLFLEKHSRKSKSIRVDFFGGEPLISFPMIKRGVEFLKSIVGKQGPEVVVTITTNGTILTREILEFLISNQVFIQFSIDGGQSVHDEHRTYKGRDVGSFGKILANMQRIYEANPEYFRKNTRIKGVITTTSLDIADAEFFSHPLIRIIVSEDHFSSLNEEPHYDLSKDSDYFARLEFLREKLLKMIDVATETDILKQLTPRQRALYHQTFGEFFEAQVRGQVRFLESDSVPFSKGCLTGYQEGAVSSNGDISICLKSAKGDNFVIGNVNEGRWYFEKMKELNTAFHRDWPGCKSCYLQKICDLCYEKLNGEQGAFYPGRNRYCEFNRARFRVMFQTMLEVCDRNPALWTHLEGMIEDGMKSDSNRPPC